MVTPVTFTCEKVWCIKYILTCNSKGPAVFLVAIVCYHDGSDDSSSNNVNFALLVHHVAFPPKLLDCHRAICLNDISDLVCKQLFR